MMSLSLTKPIGVSGKFSQVRKLAAVCLHFTFYRTIKSSIPGLIQKSQEYEVYNPETNEVFVFNRFGLHTETRNIPSDRSIFKFSYSVSTSNGKLIAISDVNGNKIKIMRDYSGQASAIENRYEKYTMYYKFLKKSLVSFAHL